MSKKVKYYYSPYYLPNYFESGGEKESPDSNSSFMQGLGGILSSVDSIDTGDPRGIYDTLDPMYQLSNKVTGGASNKVGGVLGDAGVATFKAGVSTGNPWVMLGGAALKVAGSIANIGWGGANQEKLDAANSGTSRLSQFTSRATSFDNVKSAPVVANVEDAYNGGLFRKGWAKRKNKELQKQREEAEAFANNSITNNIHNIASTQTDNLLANYAAFGGPLDFGWMPISGAIDYELAQRRLAQKDLESKKANGGPLHTHGADWTNGIVIVDNGGTHENNPFEGVPMGVAQDGTPNLVEEGEVIYNDYVFSNRIKVPASVVEKYKLKGKDGMTFADAAKKAQKESEERPNDPISQRGLEDIMNKLRDEQETIRAKRAQKAARQFAQGGYLHDDGGGLDFFGLQPLQAPNYQLPVDWSNPIEANRAIASVNNMEIKTPTLLPTNNNPFNINFNTNVPKSKALSDFSDAAETGNTGGGTGKQKGSALANLRYVPALGAGIGVFSDLMGWTNKPDYSNADAIINAANGITDVRYNPIGDYLAYTPLDRLFYANQLGAQAGATRRNIMNTSGGNRGAAMAGLLAADYNAQQQLGNLFRQAEEYNLGQRERVATFNRATNMFNSESDLKAQIANREFAKARVDAAIKAAAIRDSVDSRVSAAKSANLTNLFDSLGDIGREAYARNMIMTNPALYYSIDSQGNISYKNGYENLSEAEKDAVNDDIAKRKKSKKAKGDYLTIKRR